MFNFKKKFGQNFISDKNLLRSIVSDAKVEKTDEVLEIGAGAGSLTAVLSERAKKVVSFEIDKELMQTLQDLNLKNVHFIFDDFMNMALGEIEKEFSLKYKVVANLPYYITTPIIFKLLEESKKCESLTIMVQKEVAERICAKPGCKDYGILSCLVSLYGDASVTRVIKRQMFFPVPNVDSALVHIVLKEKFPELNKREFSKFIKTCFSMRRKTLLNNLSKIKSKEELKKLLDEETLNKRAENLSLQEFIELFNKLEKQDSQK